MQGQTAQYSADRAAAARRRRCRASRGTPEPRNLRYRFCISAQLPSNRRQRARRCSVLVTHLVRNTLSSVLHRPSCPFTSLSGSFLVKAPPPPWLFSLTRQANACAGCDLHRGFWNPSAENRRSCSSMGALMSP